MKFDLIKFYIYKNESLNENLFKDISIIFNLSDCLTVCLDDKKYQLKKNDLIVINPLTKFSVEGKDSLYIVFYINDERSRECFDGNTYLFECNSSMEISNKYDRLRKILNEIIVVTYQKNQYYYIKMNQLFYELIVELLRNFSVQIVDEEINQKKELLDYIEFNYQNDITLEDAADHFCMSKYYFSKYFKKNIGTSFHQYLTDVRLNNAIYDIEYSHKNMLQVAMNNGFSNLSSFNHYFKEKYNQSPKEYRLSLKKEDEHINHSSDLETVFEQINANTINDKNLISIEMDSNVAEFNSEYWNELLNFGKLHYLDDNQIIKQLESIQAKIGFNYLRIELEDGCYTKENYSFSKEEKWFDIIYDVNAKPWIVIDYRSIVDTDVIADYLDKLMSHFANRYSIHSIREWRIEIVYNTIFDDLKFESFIHNYKKIEGLRDKYNLHHSVMAAGLTLGNREGIKTFYDYLEKYNCIIENQTFQADPYIYYKSENGVMLSKADNSIDIYNDLKFVKKLNPYFKKYIKNTYIVSWRHSVSLTNILNDSCQKGASIIKQILNCKGQIEGISEYIPLDAMYDSNMQKKVLFGGDGLISYQGIHKPSFYAHSFLSNISGKIVFSNDNFILSKNEYGNYHAVIHNYKELGHKYYMEKEYISYDNINEYFEDLNPLSIKIKLNNIENGTYIIKKRSISPNGGSVLDELHKFMENDLDYFHPNDMHFIESISIPQIFLKSIKVESNTLETIVELSANEIVYLHIIHQF